MRNRLLAVALFLVACSSDDDSKAKVPKPEVTAEDKEELVASDNGLKKQVEALRKELDALKADVQEGNDSVVQNIFQVVADVAGVETDLSSANARIGALEAQLALVEANVHAFAASMTTVAQAAVSAATPKPLWVYDGNHQRIAQVLDVEEPDYVYFFSHIFKVRLPLYEAGPTSGPWLADSSFVRAYYLTPDCTGQPYVWLGGSPPKVGEIVFFPTTKANPSQSGYARLSSAYITGAPQSDYYASNPGCRNYAYSSAYLAPVTIAETPTIPLSFAAPITYGE